MRFKAYGASMFVIRLHDCRVCVRVWYPCAGTGGPLCQECVAGYFQGYTSPMAQCQPCSPGYFVAYPGSTGCLPCSYKDKPSQYSFW